jgi:hypothetical protein
MRSVELQNLCVASRVVIVEEQLRFGEAREVFGGGVPDARIVLHVFLECLDRVLCQHAGPRHDELLTRVVVEDVRRFQIERIQPGHHVDDLRRGPVRLIFRRRVHKLFAVRRECHVHLGL